MKIKKGILLLAVIMLMTSVLSACGGDSQTSTDKPYELVWYHHITPTRDVDLVFSEVSKLTTEKINATIQCIPIVNADYAEKLRMLIASGEKIDLFTPRGEFPNYAADGALLPLNDLLETNGKGILEALPEYAWDATSVNKEILAVPSLKDWPTHWVMWYYKKYEDKYGFDMQEVKNLEDLGEVLQIIKDNEPGITPLATNYNTALNRFLPFEMVGSTKIIGFKTDDYSKVVNVLETEEYKEFFNLMREWYQKGYFRKDAATQKSSQDLIKTHQVFADYGATIPYYEQSRNYNIPEDEHTLFAYNMAKPVIDTASLQGSMMSIYAKSENPEKAMDFMNLLFTDKDVLNMIVLGIEGKHYTAIGENKYKLAEGMTGTTNDDYYFPGAYQGNRYLLRIDEQDPDDKWEKYKEFNESAEVSPALGFIFDTTPVMNEITAMQNVYTEFIPSLLVGAADPAEYLPQAIEKFKVAGSDKVLAEVQKQYDEWKKNK